MFKKIIPAIAFMFVLALSFAFRPAGKALDEKVRVWANGVWSDGPAPSCSGTGNICFITFDDDFVTDGEAQSAASGHGDKSQDFDVDIDGNPTTTNDIVHVVVRSGQ